MNEEIIKENHKNLQSQINFNSENENILMELMIKAWSAQMIKVRETIMIIIRLISILKIIRRNC